MAKHSSLRPATVSALLVAALVLLSTLDRQLVSAKPVREDDAGGNNNPVPDACRDGSSLPCHDKCNAAQPGLKSRFTTPWRDPICPLSHQALSNTNVSCHYVASEPSCCNDCNRRSTCQFWQFWQQGNTCPAGANGPKCGICYFYPPSIKGPLCDPNIPQENITRVARPCPSTINDPHFTGAHGTRFEFNGLPDQSFCLLTDRNLHVNMRMRGYYDDRTIGASIVKNGKAVRTWIRELGFMWADAATGQKHSFRMAARDGKAMERGSGYVGSMEYDGKRLPLLQLGDSYSLPGGLNVSFVAYEKQGGGFFDVDAYTIEIAGLAKLGVRLRPAHPLLQTADDAQTHINLHFSDVQHTSDVHGVMGQTYREGRQKRAFEYSWLSVLMKRSFAADGAEGKGFLDGDAKDYRTSSVLSTDCLYTAFDGHTMPEIAEANGMIMS